MRNIEKESDALGRKDFVSNDSVDVEVSECVAVASELSVTLSVAFVLRLVEKLVEATAVSVFVDVALLVKLFVADNFVFVAVSVVLRDAVRSSVRVRVCVIS